MAGFSQVTGDPIGTVVSADNASFDGTARGGAITLNGQLFIGSTALPHLKKGSITSPLGTVTIGYSSPNITIDVAGGAAPISKINVQTGTSPILPTGGVISLNGAVVASGTNPIRTDGTASDTIAIEVQKSQAIAAADATKIGLCNFDSAKFTVDANGFVSTSGTGVTLTLTGNSGGAISPTAGNINTVGTGSITIAGAGSTLTTQLTGLTNHAVLVGAGSATITNIAATANTGAVLQNNSGADPTYSTATYPSTTTINQILFSSAANTVSGLSTANQGVLTTGATGIPVITALATNGQLIIGSTAGVPAAATITAGTGITVTNGSNSITISAGGGGFTWNDVTGGSATMAAENGYIADKSTLTTLTMPTNNSLGDTIKVVGKGSGGWTIVYGVLQNIIMGNTTSTTTTGNLSSTNANDCVEMICTTASITAPIFTVVNSIGNISIT